MTPYQTMHRRLLQGKKLLIDGATGSEVERRGFTRSAAAWLSCVCLEQPELLQQIHKDYIACGAEVIITNTFGAARHNLQEAGLDDQFEPINRRSAEIACQARQQVAPRIVLVAGSLSYYSWLDNPLSLNDLRRNAQQQAEILRQAGVDLLILEMMADIDKMQAMLEACLSAELPIWLGLSCRLDADQQPLLLAGEPLRAALQVLPAQSVDLLNIMHTEIEDVDRCLDVVQAHWHGPVGVYPHSKQNEVVEWHQDYAVAPEILVEHCQRWLRRGVDAVGGCCGIHAAHIAALQPVVAQFS